MKKKNMFSKHDDGGVDMINGEQRPAIHLLHGSSLSSCHLSLSLLPLTPPPHTSVLTRCETGSGRDKCLRRVTGCDGVFFVFFGVGEKKKTRPTPKKQVFCLFLNSTLSRRKKNGKKEMEKKVMDEVVKFSSQLVSASRLAASILSFIPEETHRRVSCSN